MTGLKAEKAQKDRSEISAIICCVQAQCATRQWWPMGLVPVKGNLPQKLLLFSRNQDYFQPASTQKLLCCPVIKIVSSVDQPVIKKSGSRLPPAPAWPVACIHPWLPSLSKFEGIRLVEVSRLSDLSTYKCYLSIDWQCKQPRLSHSSLPMKVARHNCFKSLPDFDGIGIESELFVVTSSNFYSKASKVSWMSIV